MIDLKKPSRLLAVLAVAIPLVVGCGGTPTTPAKTDPPPVPPSGRVTPTVPQPGKGTPTVPQAEEPKELRVTAEPFTAEFEKNFRAAKDKYFGKTVEVTGAFDEFWDNNLGGEPEIKLGLRGTPTSGDPGFARLFCKITAKQFDADPRLRALARGQSVTLRGKVQDYRDVSLTDCTVVTFGPTTAVPTTLLEIEAEAGEKGDAVGKFKDRDVLVRATISKATWGGAGWKCTAVAPKGAKKDIDFTSARLGEEYSKELDALKAGDSVILLGHLDKAFAEGRLQISGVRVLKAVPEGLKLPDEKK